MGTLRLTTAAAPTTPAPAASSDEPSRKAAPPKASAADVRGLQAELARLKKAITKPGTTFVCTPEAKIMHKASKFEDSNPPTQWRTECGWAYGLTNFLRTSTVPDGSRRCKKCFDLSEDSSSSDSDSSGISDQDFSSASSAAGDYPSGRVSREKEWRQRAPSSQQVIPPLFEHSLATQAG